MREQGIDVVVSDRPCLKLVNPDEKELVRGEDGMFRLKSGQPAPADPSAKPDYTSIVRADADAENVVVTDADVAGEMSGVGVGDGDNSTDPIEGARAHRAIGEYEA